jgi:hypothetical protein
MEGAALVVQTEHAVMVVGIGTSDSRLDGKVPVGSNRRRFIYIESVVADQRDDPHHLRDREQCQQAGAETAYRSQRRHEPGCPRAF